MSEIQQKELNKLIYVSSSCVKARTIKEACIKLNNEGYSNIELSGGTDWYPEWEKDLIEVRETLGLSLLAHNYFPPPKNSFVLNLASLNNEIHKLSVSHVRQAIDFSKRIGSSKLAIHAGFRLDIPLVEIGKKLSKFPLFPLKSSYDRFCDTYKILKEEAAPEVELYIENNVLSESNAALYSDEAPFFVVDHNGYKELYTRTKASLLLDVAHLKVSTSSMGIDFKSELDRLWNLTDYVHLSDNDGRSDTNLGIKSNSILLNQLRDLDFKGKTFTLEVYESMSALQESYNLLTNLVGN